MDFAVVAVYRVELKESEKKDVYFDLSRERKKKWKLKMTVIPIISGAIGTVTKGLIKRSEVFEISDRV